MKLFKQVGEVDYFWLKKREWIMGAQLMYALLVVLQPVVMVTTTQTAIARLDDVYGAPAQALGTAAFMASVLLVVDAIVGLRDARNRTGWTGTYIMRLLNKYRSVLYFVCGLWALALMYTAKAEQGLIGMIMYMVYFGVHLSVPMFLHVSMGCQVNDRQKAVRARSEKRGVNATL